MNIENFEAAFAHRQNQVDAHHAAYERLRAEYADTLLAAARKAFPRRRFTHVLAAASALGDDVEATIYQPFRKALDALLLAHDEALRQIDLQLEVLAGITEIPRTAKLNKVAQSMASLWRSQGLGASTYARGHAEADADIARALGLTVEVREGEAYPGAIPLQDYTVWVNTTLIGWEVAVRRNAVPLRAWVMNCWNRGCNPRVFYPFLPERYETILDLQYGIDLRKPKPEAAPIIVR